MELYDSNRSASAYRVRIALALKGLDYRAIPLSLSRNGGEQLLPEYRAVNPQGMLPSLVDDDFIVTQSLAIIEYLDETKPGPKLLPADPLGRARVRSLSMLVAAEIHPLNNLRVLNHLRDALKLDKAAIADWYRHWCDEGLAAFERQLADGASGRFCHGDQPTMADACLVPQIFNARRFETKVERYPAVMRIFDECMALEAFRKAEPSAQPEASRTE